MPDQNQLKVELSGEKTFGPCDCCGQMTSRVWGYVYSDDRAVAAYFVEWTPGHEGSCAMFDLIIGQWGEGTSPFDRKAVSLEFRKLDNGPAFRVVDANNRTVANSSLISQALDRDDVIGTTIASHIFAICDAVYLEDPRLSELRL
jgi:hypothetical protein